MIQSHPHHTNDILDREDKFYILKHYEDDDTFWGVITLVGFIAVAGLFYYFMGGGK